MAWFCYFVLAILLLNTETDLEFLVLDKKKKSSFVDYSKNK